MGAPSLVGPHSPRRSASLTMDKAASSCTIIAEPEGIVAYHKSKPLYDSVRELLRTDSATPTPRHVSSARTDAIARWDDSPTIRDLGDGTQRLTADPAIVVPRYPSFTGEAPRHRARNEVSKASEDGRQNHRCYYVYMLQGSSANVSSA